MSFVVQNAPQMIFCSNFIEKEGYEVHGEKLPR